MADFQPWTARWRRWAFEDDHANHARLERLAVFLTRLLYGIVRKFADGQLNRQEASRLRNEFYDIARLERRYRANGLSGWERADLDRRFDVLSSKIRWERRDNDRYGYGYGYRR